MDKENVDKKVEEVVSSTLKHVNQLVEIGNLNTYLEEQNRKYHNEGSSDISDFLYDSKIAELKRLVGQDENLKRKATILSRIGAQSTSEFGGFKKYRHNLPMGSLENIFNDSNDSLRKWLNNVFKAQRTPINYIYTNGNYNYSPETLVVRIAPKYDGVAISLIGERVDKDKSYFNEFSLTRATLRGDGEEGDNVRRNLTNVEYLYVTKVPAWVNNHEERGEIVMLKNDFEDLNSELIKQGLKPFSSARSAVVSTLRQQNPEIAKARKLYFMPYLSISWSDDFTQFQQWQGPLLDIHKKFNREPASVSSFDSLNHIKEFTLEIKTEDKTSNNPDTASLISKVLEATEVLLGVKNNLPFECDGVVISIDTDSDVKNTFLASYIDRSKKLPSHMVAFKAVNIALETTLKGVTFQTGKFGIITPVAEVETIEIGGVNISRASLANLNKLEELKPSIGDRVELIRSGDVIPKILGISLRSGGEPIPAIDKCPSCGSKVSIVPTKNSKFLLCSKSLDYTTRYSCDDQFLGLLTSMVSDEGFDIEGISEGIIKEYMDTGSLVDLADFFNPTNLYQYFIEEINGKVDTNSHSYKLLERVERSKNIKLENFIYALGIPRVGRRGSLVLAMCFKNLGDLLELKEEVLRQNLIFRSSNFGEHLISIVVPFFNNEYNKLMIGKFISNGVNVIPYENSDGILGGLSFSITGALTKPRNEITKLIYSLGGSVSKKPGKGTTYLIVGSSPTNATVVKAQKLGVKTINEAELLTILKRDSL